MAGGEPGAEAEAEAEASVEASAETSAATSAEASADADVTSVDPTTWDVTAVGDHTNDMVHTVKRSILCTPLRTSCLQF